MTRAPTPAARTWAVVYADERGRRLVCGSQHTEAEAKKLAPSFRNGVALDLSAAIRLAGRVLVGERWVARRGDVMVAQAPTQERCRALVRGQAGVRVICCRTYRLPRAEVRR